MRAETSSAKSPRARPFFGVTLTARNEEAEEASREQSSHAVTASATATAHASLPEAVARQLKVDPALGLAPGEVAARRARDGPNRLPSIRPRSAWRILADQFASIVVALLGAAALISWMTADHAEALAILLVLALNALVGFLMEWQAGRALDALRREARTSARVRRGGGQLCVPAAELVCGDILILNAGDRVPADARLLEATGLRVEESALTGESAPVEKDAAPVHLSALLAERRSMLYLGTTVVAGHGAAIVTATGERTELGRIGRLVADTPEERAPLEQRLAQLGRRLVFVVLAIALLVMIVGWLRGLGWWVMLKVSISLAVAAVPEGLPAVTTLILALGMLRLARHRVLVRRLPAVETLGSTTIICTDKTGTLTENRMTVREYHLADGRRLALSSDPLPPVDDLLRRALRVSVLCNEASYEAARGEGEARAVGDPTETALLAAADRWGMDVARVRAAFPKLDERPFDARRMWMSTLHRDADGARLVMLKGAPAVVLELCTSFAPAEGLRRPLDEAARARFLAANEEMGGRALRVLALAERYPADEIDRLPTDEGGDTFLGLVGMIDPPREGVAEALRRAHEAGIRTVMLTGDQLQTARAVARELRLSADAELLALHARDLVGADHTRLAEMARTVDVFARVAPADKLRIVEALARAGEIVAVTGDGVNDAPALKRAEIGIAMGLRGTEVAKEAADVVLADDNFSSIVRAVEGGRTIYANILKFVHMMFSHNLGEVLFIFGAIVAGWPLPLLPLQILWINLVTDVFPALALAVEPPTPGVMRRRPRDPRAALLSTPFLLLIFWQGALLAALTLAAYVWALALYGPGAHARTIALVALVGVQLGHLFNCRSRTRSALDGLFRNPFVWVAALLVITLQLMGVYLSPLARILGTVPINAADWIVMALSILLPILFVEMTKLFARHRRLRA